MTITHGFLGTGATFAADFNLVAHVVMGLVLIGGAVLARRRKYTAHKYVPSFRSQVEPGIPGRLNMVYYGPATAHAGAGVIAQVLGIYVIAAAGTNLVPSRLRFDNYKAWMRTLLFLWWAVVLLGIATYYVWYMGPL
jgi:uncharacterized membrane protein YozB (DUF420 family)